MPEINKELFEYLNSIEIFDTHEHLSPYEYLRDRNTYILKEYMIQCQYGHDIRRAPG